MKAWKKVSPVISSERMYITLGDLERFKEKHTVLPELNHAFDMFRMIMPQDVKVVMIGQSPYPGVCTATGVPYACGPAFLPAASCATTPLTLKNIMLELSREYQCSSSTKPPRDVLLDWIDQGVMLLNSSLTIGANCPGYLKDHSIMWREVVEGIVHTIGRKIDPVFVLIGKDAWRFDSCLLPKTRVVMVSHPVSRKDTDTPWLGSGVFSKVSDLMMQRGEDPIKWIR